MCVRARNSQQPQSSQRKVIKQCWEHRRAQMRVQRVKSVQKGNEGCCCSQWLNKFQLLGSAVHRNSRSSGKPYVSVFPALTQSPSLFLSTSLFFLSFLPRVSLLLSQMWSSPGLWLFATAPHHCVAAVAGGVGDAVRNNEDEEGVEEEEEKWGWTNSQATQRAATETPPGAAFRCFS